MVVQNYSTMRELSMASFEKGSTDLGASFTSNILKTVINFTLVSKFPFDASHVCFHFPASNNWSISCSCVSDPLYFSNLFVFSLLHLLFYSGTATFLFFHELCVSLWDQQPLLLYQNSEPNTETTGTTTHFWAYWNAELISFGESLFYAEETIIFISAR